MAILEKETYKKFGYYPSEISPKSQKRILVTCDCCGVIREGRKDGYCSLCRSCAAKKRSNSGYIIYQELNNYEFLQQKYWEEGLTQGRIAKIVGCTPATVSDALKRAGVRKRTKSEDVAGKNNPFWGKHHTEKTKRKISECQRGSKHVFYGTHRNEETKRKIGNANRGKHRSEEAKRKIRGARMKQKGFPMHHTVPELIFEKICKKYGLPFHFVGDGQLWIGRNKKLNPDFIEANGKKICVEVMGDYWHSPLINNKIPEGGTLIYRKNHYKRYKWTPIFLWESDLKREDAEHFVLGELKKNGVL